MYRLLLILLLTALPALAQTQADTLRAQQELVNLGYDLTADGEDSLAMKAAIRAYQRDWQLPEDGILDDHIYGRLIRTDPATAPKVQKVEGRDCLVKIPQPQARETVSHEGPCKAGVRDGEGKTTWRWIVNGVWKESTYAGMFRDGKLNGKGELRYANSDVYIGDWVDDKRTGKGEYRYADGDVYIGGFVDDKFTGKGEYRAANGDVYIGDFVDNRPHGWGTLLSDGQSYEGIWTDGCLDTATLQAAEGRSIESCGF